MVFVGELGRQNAASQQKLRTTRLRVIKPRRSRDEQQTVIFQNLPVCSSWIVLVEPIHVHLFHILVIFVSDQVHNQDKYLNVFEDTSFLSNAH